MILINTAEKITGLHNCKIELYCAAHIFHGCYSIKTFDNIVMVELRVTMLFNDNLEQCV